MQFREIIEVNLLLMTVFRNGDSADYTYYLPTYNSLGARLNLKLVFKFKIEHPCQRIESFFNWVEANLLFSNWKLS